MKYKNSSNYGKIYSKKFSGLNSLINHVKDDVIYSSVTRAVPSTRAAGAYSSSIKLELYFWARVLDNFLQTPNSDKKLANLLPKRLSHNYGTNLALPGTMQINSGTIPAIPLGAFLAPDIKTLTYLPCRVLEYSIRYSTEYSSSKKARFAQPYLWLRV